MSLPVVTGGGTRTKLTEKSLPSTEGISPGNNPVQGLEHSQECLCPAVGGVGGASMSNRGWETKPKKEEGFT